MTVDQVRTLVYNPGVCPICQASFPVLGVTLDHIEREHE